MFEVFQRVKVNEQAFSTTLLGLGVGGGVYVMCMHASVRVLVLLQGQRGSCCGFNTSSFQDTESEDKLRFMDGPSQNSSFIQLIDGDYSINRQGGFQ